MRSQADTQPVPLPEPRRKGLQERVARAIVEAAAHVMASRAEDANMTDVANEAGIARATLYRYFSSRSDLLDAVASLAAHEAGQRLSVARLDSVDVREGVVRAVRALFEVGDPLIAVARERVRPNADAFTDAVEAPLVRLVERGQATGELRSDIPSSWLADMLIALVVTALASRPLLGREDAVDAITGIYLDGTHARPSALSRER